MSQLLCFPRKSIVSQRRHTMRMQQTLWRHNERQRLLTSQRGVGYVSYVRYVDYAYYRSFLFLIWKSTEPQNAYVIDCSSGATHVSAIMHAATSIQSMIGILTFLRLQRSDGQLHAGEQEPGQAAARAAGRVRAWRLVAIRALWRAAAAVALLPGGRHRHQLRRQVSTPRFRRRKTQNNTHIRVCSTREICTAYLCIFEMEVQCIKQGPAGVSVSDVFVSR